MPFRVWNFDIRHFLKRDTLVVVIVAAVAAVAAVAVGCFLKAPPLPPPPLQMSKS